MPLFEWKDEYSVSVQRFDREHQKLFGLINELNDAMAEGRGRFVAVRILRELNEYARWHFSGEESAMRRAGYPELEQHVAEHEEFVRTINVYYEEYSGGQSGIPIDLLFFLRDWLTKHILQSDRRYAETMNKAGIH